MKIDESRYREVMGCPPEGRRAWEFRLSFFAEGQTLNGKRPEVSAWVEKFGDNKENLYFSTHECDWKKARKLAASHASRLGLSVVEVRVPEDK